MNTHKFYSILFVRAIEWNFKQWLYFRCVLTFIIKTNSIASFLFRWINAFDDKHFYWTIATHIHTSCVQFYCKIQKDNNNSCCQKMQPKFKLKIANEQHDSLRLQNSLASLFNNTILHEFRMHCTVHWHWPKFNDRSHTTKKIHHIIRLNILKSRDEKRGKKNIDSFLVVACFYIRIPVLRTHTLTTTDENETKRTK